MPKPVFKYRDALYPKEWDLRDTDPVEVIDRFFSFHSLKHYRTYITSMLKAAYSEGYWKKSYPGSLLNFQKKMEELMITAHTLNQQKQDVHHVAWRTTVILSNFTFKDETIPLSSYGRDGKTAMWECFPRSLSKQEFINPFLAFELFFKNKEIEEWMMDFKNLVSYALAPFGRESALDFDYLRIHILLLKLVEAAHLMDVRLKEKSC